MSCTFCRIAAGAPERPFLDEGKGCFVILDRNQAARGHLLVIPKVHVMQWHELDTDVAVEMAEKLRGWTRALVDAIRPDGYNILVNNGSAAGQDVFHLHAHITPRWAGDGYYGYGGGHRVLSADEAAALAAELARHAPKR